MGGASNRFQSVLDISRGLRRKINLIFPTPPKNIGMIMCSVVQLCPTLWGLMDCGLPSFSAHGIFQTRIYWWGVPFPTPGDLPNPGLESHFLCFLHWKVDSLSLAPPGEPWHDYRCLNLRWQFSEVFWNKVKNYVGHRCNKFIYTVSEYEKLNIIYIPITLIS